MLETADYLNSVIKSVHISTLKLGNNFTVEFKKKSLSPGRDRRREESASKKKREKKKKRTRRSEETEFPSSSRVRK